MTQVIHILACLALGLCYWALAAAMLFEMLKIPPHGGKAPPHAVTVKAIDLPATDATEGQQNESI